MAAERIEAIERLIGQDVGRNTHALVEAARGGLQAAARSIAEHEAPAIGIISGFFIPHATPPAAENDGPVGTAHLARAFNAAGVEVRVATDTACAGALRTALDAAGVEVAALDVVAWPRGEAAGDGLLEVTGRWRQAGLSHVVAIERCGAGADGRPRNARGHDIRAHTAPLEELLHGGPWTTIGIGDGGNELGMGALPAELIAEHVDLGELVACRVAADHLIVAGISNWAGWALPACLALLREDWRDAMLLGLDAKLDRHILETTNEQGPAVDGMLGHKALSVDRVPWEDQRALLERIRELVE